MTYPMTKRRSVVEEIRRLEEIRGGVVPTAVVNDVANELGCAPATLWRWIADDRAGAVEPPLRGGHLRDLTDDHIQVIFTYCGDIAKAKRELDKTDVEIAAMSEATFRRRWDRVDPAVRAMAEGGATALLNKQIRILYSAKERNEVWHIDHQEIPIWVLPRGHSATPVKPWMTTIIDDSTRRIMATLLTVVRPTAEMVTVALADAMRIKHIPGTAHRVGGVPQTLHSDNGGEFKAVQYTEALARLGVSRKVSQPYLKHQNGKVERVQRTFQDELIKSLPGYSQAPQTLKRKDLFGRDTQLLSEDALAVYIDEWVDSYNAERPHGSLGGKTPDEVWCAQETPLRTLDPEALRLAMLLADRPAYKVHAAGVSFRGQYFTAPDLATNGMVGREVQVRYMPTDESFIEVFYDGEWMCTAVPHVNLTDEQREQIISAGKDQYTHARAYHAAAAERRRTMVFSDPDRLGVTGLARDDDLSASDDDYLNLSAEAAGADAPQPTEAEVDLTGATPGPDAKASS